MPKEQVWKLYDEGKSVSEVIAMGCLESSAYAWHKGWLETRSAESNRNDEDRHKEVKNCKSQNTNEVMDEPAKTALVFKLLRNRKRKDLTKVFTVACQHGMTFDEVKKNIERFDKIPDFAVIKSKDLFKIEARLLSLRSQIIKAEGTLASLNDMEAAKKRYEEILAKLRNEINTLNPQVTQAKAVLEEFRKAPEDLLTLAMKKIGTCPKCHKPTIRFVLECMDCEAKYFYPGRPSRF